MAIYKATDFDRALDTFGRALTEKLGDTMDRGNAAGLVREVMRMIWNARGAADIAKIETELSSMMGPTAAGPYLKNLGRSLRSLDVNGDVH